MQLGFEAKPLWTSRMDSKTVLYIRQYSIHVYSYLLNSSKNILQYYKYQMSTFCLSGSILDAGDRKMNTKHTLPLRSVQCTGCHRSKG